MIGGIFCQCEIGKIYEPRRLKSVSDYCLRLVGERLTGEKELRRMLADKLWKTAYSALSKYASTKHTRDFRNDTIDLLRSMGVVVMENGNINIKDVGENIAQFGATKASREVGKPRARTHPAPYNRLHTFIEEMPIFARDGWAVAFVVTMPYATRLEHERVDETGGYGKRVLLGNINSIVNAFYRDFWPEKRKKIWYGYCFEKGGFELTKANSTSAR